MRENHENALKSVYQMVFMLMQSAMIIGTSVAGSAVAKEIFRRDQVTVAQLANSEKAKAR